MRRLAALLALGLLALAGLALAPPAHAGTRSVVSGEVSGVWTADGNPYYVVESAWVAPGKGLTIGPGVQLRFAPGTGLLVKGSLSVQGADAAPVSFTSNGTATPGSWAGVVVEGAVFARSLSIAYASTGLELRGASADLDRLSVRHSSEGLFANGTSAVVGPSSFSFNEAAGVRAMNSILALLRPEIAGSGWGLVLQAAVVTVDNGSIAGGFLGDADLSGSRLVLRNTTTGGAYQFHEGGSVVEERWFAHGLVRDAWGTPVPSAAVTVEGGGLPVPVQRMTGPDGSAPWIELLGRTHAMAGVTTPVYGFTATARGSTGQRSLSILASGVVELALPDDVTDPVADAGPDLDVDEDAPVALSAAGSTDNDPSFPSGATAAWSFDDRGTPVQLTGGTASYTFATPGAYDVLLRVTDAAGNEGLDLLRVTVRDRTPPVPAIAAGPEVRVGESLVLDGAGSADNDPGFPETANFTWTIALGGQTRVLYGRTVSFAGWWAAGDANVTLTVRDAAGNAASASRIVRVAPAPGVDLWWVAGGLAAWFAALGTWGTERGRMAFLSWFVLPLYTRMRKDEVLDQFTRGQIFGYVVVHPGDSYADIKRNLQLNNGTLTYHLNVLERDGLVVARNAGSRKLFYAKGTRVPEDGGGMHEVQQQILRHLRETGGLAVSDVAGVLGISRQLAIYHLRDLSRRGLVRIERRSFRIVAFAEEPRGPMGPP